MPFFPWTPGRAVEGSDVVDELLEFVALQFRTAHGTEKRGQSGKRPLVRGHIGRKFVTRDGGKMEELLFFVFGHAEELSPAFKNANVLGRRGDPARILSERE